MDINKLEKEIEYKGYKGFIKQKNYSLDRSGE